MTTTSRIVPGAVVLLLALTGCAGTASPDETNAAPTEPTSAPAQTTAPDENDTDAATGMTKPGTELDLGESATVLFHDDDAGTSAPMTFTVTSIDQGDSAELADTPYATVGEVTPFYVRYTVTIGAGADQMAYKPVDMALSAVQDDGTPAVHMLSSGTWEACDSSLAYIPEGATEGTTLDLCEPFVVLDDAKVVAVELGGALYTPEYDAKPITWM